MSKLFPSQLERFWKKVDKGDSDSCWLWNAAKDKDGYGLFDNIRAHRFAWMAANGPIPARMLVCHRCDVPSCVRPDHLFLGTNTDNMADMVRKQRAKRGSEINTAVLCTNDVRSIRESHRQGVTQTALSHQYSVAQTTISAIVRGATWRHC